MFNLKASLFGQNAEDKRQNTALPNSFGKVRTLKEDLDNLNKGVGEIEISNSIPPQNQPFPMSPPPANAPPPPGPNKSFSETPMPQAAHPPERAYTPQPNADINPPKEPQKNEVNPFPESLGSSSYFEKSPFEETKPAKVSETAAEPKKYEGKTVMMVLSIVIAVAVLGGGFYYYWFILKKAPEETNQELLQKAPVADTVPPAQENPESENKNLRHLNVDLASSPEGLKNEIKKMADEFVGSSPANGLIEVNVLDKNNQAIKIKDFLTSLGITLPETTSNRFLDNYTLFIKNDGSEARLGAVFELSGIDGFAAELSQQEKSLPTKFRAFYIKQAPLETDTPFNSSQYGNANIRFLNFPNLSNTSFDYAIVKGKQASYLVTGTSKNTTQSILDYMAGK